MPRWKLSRHPVSTGGPPAGPTRSRSTEQSTWAARPAISRLLRGIALLTPILVGAITAITANDLISPATTVGAAILRSIAIMAVSTLTVWGADRLARRLLPLAALMRLSLVFPDQAPSRFRSAVRNGSSKRLERNVAAARTNGLSSDPGEAARQVVDLISAIGDHDRRTRGHSERVRMYADLLGEELKLSTAERQKLQWGALLHDLGKLMVPPEILNKNGAPTAEEWEILKGHPGAGMDLIEPLREFLGEWVHAIGGHHEKVNGSGYPQGLVGNQIPRSATIVAVADSFEVMTAVRSYKKAMSIADARAELTRCAGTHFSPEVVRAFLNISLGRLRIVTGPLAALAHLPFVSVVTQMPTAATTSIAAFAPTLSAATAIPAAAIAATVALAAGPTMASPVEPDAVEINASSDSSAAGGAVDVSGRTGGGDNRASAGVPPAGAAVAAGDSATPGGATASPSSTTTPFGTATTTTTTTTVGSADDPHRSSGPTTTAPVVGRSGAATTTTTTQPLVAPATAPPTTAAAPTTTTTTAPPAPPAPPANTGTFAILASKSEFRIPSFPLHGATIERGDNIYVMAAINATSVTYTYPGGSRTATMFPFDMMGPNGIRARQFQVPNTVGIYTITATATGTTSGTVTATFFVVDDD